MQFVSTKLHTPLGENWGAAHLYEDLYKILGFGQLRVESIPQIGTVMVLDHNTIGPTRWEQVIERVSKDYCNVKKPGHIKLHLALLSIEQQITNVDLYGVTDLELEDNVTLVFKMDIKFQD